MNKRNVCTYSDNVVRLFLAEEKGETVLRVTCHLQGFSQASFLYVRESERVLCTCNGVLSRCGVTEKSECLKLFV